MEVLSNKYTEEEILRRLQKKLDEKRYTHSIGVAHTAVALMMAHGRAQQSTDKGQREIAMAYTAGLLHDCAKCLSTEERDKYCSKYRVELTQMEQEHPFLIHAKLGAVLAKEKYGIDDPQILSAIRWHTTGTEKMTLLESIVFSADFIEPNRRMLDCLPKIRQVIYRDLPYAVYLILQQTMVHLEHKGQPVDEHSLRALEYYRQFERS
ncbi:MAG: bis(5'-nucleosyl)-tetraphosphatase (symmetrical) YqeK [Lachnospiraceae bacterium]|nr:bis(5'-nucleosyl)-tetraphosphatase (symmetrical) YqeK [Lachnospiraceae bacterium]